MKKLSLITTLVAFYLAAVPAHGGIIITEMMANPSGSDALGEYFELYNSGGSAVDIGSFTIKDDDSDSIDLASLTGTFINPGEFLVFGNEDTPYIDVDYSTAGSFILANSGDEIVIVETSSGTELARLNYGSGFVSSGVSRVLNDISNSVGGVADSSNYIPEIAANGTLPNGDIGSPGIAGSTLLGAVPEPGTATIFLLGFAGLAFRRQR